MRVFPAGLACLMFLQSVIWAQEGGGLNIVVIEGEGAINNIRQRTAREPIVQVEDRNRKPVAGAAVVFMLPDRGASGIFPNGSRTLTVMTDENGRAAARGLRPNTVRGDVQIRVTASHQGRTGSATITQTNVLTGAAAAAAGGGLAAKWILLIAAGAAAAVAGGVVAATGDSGNNGGSPAARTPTTVTPGSGTVGPPR